jgi:hypothetical protein
MIISILFIFYKSGLGGVSNSGWFDLSGLADNHALNSSIIYFLFSGFTIIFAIVASMYATIGILPEGYSYYLLCNRVDFELLGRYIDPIVPAIFLFGLIGLDRMHEAKKEHRLKVIPVIIVAYVLLSFIFAVSFPYSANKGADILPIYYTKYLANIIPVWAIVPLISSIFFLGLYLRINNKKFRYLLLIFIILFSLITSAWTIEKTTLPGSINFRSQSQIGIYLEEHFDDTATVLMDSEDNIRDMIMMSLTKFWTNMNFVTHSTPEDPSGVYTDYARNISYIISSKILPYERVAYSTRGYLLYKPAIVKDNRSLNGFDMTEGWNSMELWNGLPTSWMKSNATITVYSDRDLPATLSFSVQSLHANRTLQVYYQDTLRTQVEVPTSFVRVSIPIGLKRGANHVHFNVLESCQRPIDIPELKNIDSRCLSVAFQNLSICARNETAVDE